MGGLLALGVAANVAFAWASGALAPAASRLLGSPALYAAAALALAPWLTHAARLLVWARFFGRPLGPRSALECVLANEVGSAITPTAVGGGYAKLLLLVQKGFTPGTAASLMVLGSVEDYACFLLVLPEALALSGGWRPSFAIPGLSHLSHRAIAIALAVALLAGVLVTSRAAVRRLHVLTGWRQRLGAARRDFVAAFRLIAARGKARIALTLGLAVVHWACRFGVAAVLLAAIGSPLNPARVFLLQLVVYVAGAVVPTPGGAFGVETVFFLAYRPLVPREILPALVASWRLLTFYLPLALGAGLFALLQFGRSRPDAAALPPPA